LGASGSLYRFLAAEFAQLSSPTKYTRPLSPFLLYRWQYTMALSFLHRLTGCALAVGLLLLVYWLLAAASGSETYEHAQTVFAHPLIRLALIGFSFCFFYHLLNGTRHLVWDAGYGFEKKVARASGWLAFLGAVVLTGFFWFLLRGHMHGSGA
jgi:succinate dehydrogenase / fumarate reductase cytochrome b subunit